MTTYTARVPNSTVGSNAAFITGVNPTMHGSITDNVNNTFVEIPPYNASGPGYFDVGLP